MIFGFNTDIKHADTVYHVQSEARQAEQLLQTQVFVRGRCIGKHANSYAQHHSRADFSDDLMHELLKEQHRTVIDSIRNGTLDELLLGHAATPASNPKPAESAGSPESQFTLEFLNPDALAADGAVVLRFRVAENSSCVSGAKLISKLSAPALSEPLFTQATTGSDGVGELRIPLNGTTPDEASVLVQATLDGRTATRKFILRPRQQS
jgi:hypothetical protein